MNSPCTHWVIDPSPPVPEPYKYNPDRWLRPDPIPNVAHPFLAWGAGKHPCAGTKTAKLELKLILAIFLAGYEFDLVDKDGKFPDPLPVPDRNNVHQVCVEPWTRCSIWTLIASLHSPCLGSPPRSHVLLKLREGHAVGGWPPAHLHGLYLHICFEALYKCRW